MTKLFAPRSSTLVPHRRRVAVALMVGGVLAACGSTSSTSARHASGLAVAADPAAAYPTQVLARDFQTITGGEASLRSWFSAEDTDGLLRARTSAQIAEQVGPWADAVNQAERSAVLVSWPVAVVNDVHAWLLSGVTVINDLQDVTFLPDAGVPQWIRDVEADAHAQRVAENAVRTDLGLPAVR